MELIPVFFSSENKKLDKYTIDNYFSASHLMGFAAISVFHHYQNKFRNNPVLLICGSGNNGGDGLALAWFLIQEGFGVTLFVKDGKHSPEFLFYLKLISARTPVRQLENFPDFSVKENSVIVDCLLGTGFVPPLSDLLARVIHKINSVQHSKQAQVISIDTPSGYYPDVKTDKYVKHDYLAEIGVRKFENIFIKHQGEYSFHPIGFPVAEYLHRFPGFLQLFPAVAKTDVVQMLQRNKNSNKYENGSLSLVGGSSGMQGAVMLSQKAFHMSGGGISKIFTPSYDTILSVVKNDPSMMVQSVANIHQDDFFKKSKIIIIGPGLNANDFPYQPDELMRLLPEKATVVVDAGAISYFANIALGDNFILTPHSGEFLRLVHTSQANWSDKTRLLQDYAARYNCHILLKDFVSLYCDPQKNIRIHCSPNEKLAVMGSGDMLTGILARYLHVTKNIPEAIHASLSFMQLITKINTKNPTANEMLDYAGTLL